MADKIPNVSKAFSIYLDKYEEIGCWDHFNERRTSSTVLS